MKRRIVALLVLAVLSFAAVAETSALYPVRLDVVKVFSHAEGYKVLYRYSAMGVADIMIPITWFTSGGKAEIVRGTDHAYPYAVVYYKDGKFDHLKLYVKADYRDPSWGQLSQDEGKGKFDGVTDIALKF